MPNIIPSGNRGNYRLYENKPGMDEGAEESTRRLIGKRQAKRMRNTTGYVGRIPYTFRTE